MSKTIRCAMCNNVATANHFVDNAGGLLSVCAKCNFILTLDDRITSLENKICEILGETPQPMAITN